jgi:ribosomal protein L7/L12
MKNRLDLISECESLLTRSADNEEVMSYLRSQGCSKIDSIAVLRKVLKISLKDAKELVHCSTTWQDVRYKDDAFHEQFVETLKSTE